MVVPGVKRVGCVVLGLRENAERLESVLKLPLTTSEAKALSQKKGLSQR
jgi:hypothetical protein